MARLLEPMDRPHSASGVAVWKYAQINRFEIEKIEWRSRSYTFFVFKAQPWGVF